MTETIICVGGAAFVGIQLTSNWIVARMGKSEDGSRCSLGGLAEEDEVRPLKGADAGVG